VNGQAELEALDLDLEASVRRPRERRVPAEQLELRHVAGCEPPGARVELPHAGPVAGAVEAACDERLRRAAGGDVPQPSGDLGRGGIAGHVEARDNRRGAQQRVAGGGRRRERVRGGA